jgi:hypothetical protein
MSYEINGRNKLLPKTLRKCLILFYLKKPQMYIFIPNSVGLVRERTISTERPSLVGEVNAKFSELKRGGSLPPYSRFF